MLSPELVRQSFSDRGYLDQSLVADGAERRTITSGWPNTSLDTSRDSSWAMIALVTGRSRSRCDHGAANESATALGGDVRRWSASLASFLDRNGTRRRRILGLTCSCCQLATERGMRQRDHGRNSTMSSQDSTAAGWYPYPWDSRRVRYLGWRQVVRRFAPCLSECGYLGSA